MAKAKIKKNLNQIIKKAMHRPMSSDGFALYAKVPGYNGSEPGEALAEKSEMFTKQSVNNYNSPTNIRKLFITGSGVIVQYYSAMVTKGTQTTPKWHSVKFDSDDNLFKIAEEIMTYGQKMHLYSGEKAINPSAKEPDNYSVDGNGIGVVSSPWVCNNIEEIYFDWTLLISTDVAPYFREFCNIETYGAFLNKSTPAQEINSNNLVSYFSAFNSGGIKDLRKRYPRLKFIAMISNLEDVLNHPSMIKVDQSFNDVEASTKTWYEVNRGLIGQSNSIVMLYDLSSDLEKPSRNFIVKDGVYKFDFEKLKGTFEQYTTKVDDLKRQRMYGTSSNDESVNDVVANIEMTEVEQRLVEIETQFGEAVLKKALVSTALGCEMPTSELKKLFMQFTKPNRKRMASMMGLNLD